MSWSGLAILLLASLFVWGVGAYNRLMRLRNAISSSWEQFEAPLNELAQLGVRLADAGPRWLPQEASAFEALRRGAARRGGVPRRDLPVSGCRPGCRGHAARGMVDG